MAASASLLGLGRKRPPTVRPARPGEPVARVLDASGFGPHVGRLLGYPRNSPDGEVLVAEVGRGRLVGAAGCASFGATGWIGALGVLPRARRKGTGTMLTEGAVGWLRDRGARTVLLYATEQGRPVYERLGFVAEAPAHAWRGSPPPGALPDGARRLREDDRPAVLDLDRAATGEDRWAILEQLPALVGVGVERSGGLVAAAVQTPWGAGPGVVAADPAAGVAMLRALALEPQPLTLTVPEDNPHGTELLRAWGFRVVNTALRMRLGPPVGHDPARMYGLTNLFWG